MRLNKVKTILLNIAKEYTTIDDEENYHYEIKDFLDGTHQISFCSYSPEDNTHLIIRTVDSYIDNKIVLYIQKLKKNKVMLEVTRNDILIGEKIT